MWQRCCCPCGVSRRLESDKVTCTDLFFCGFLLPFYHSVHLCSLLASELLHHISTMSRLAAASFPQSGSLPDESLTLKRCQGRKYYLPASSDECWGLKKGLWKGRSHQWADCCSKWGTPCSCFWLWVIMILLVMYCGSHPMPLETTQKAQINFSHSLIKPSTHRDAIVWFYCHCSAWHRAAPALIHSDTSTSPHKQCFAGARYNPWWQKEVTFSWMWADFEVGFLMIYCDCSGKCFTSVLFSKCKISIYLGSLKALSLKL